MRAGARFVAYFLICGLVAAVFMLLTSGCSGEKFGSESWQVATGGARFAQQADTGGAPEPGSSVAGAATLSSTGGQPEPSSSSEPAASGGSSQSGSGNSTGGASTAFQATGGNGPDSPCDGTCSNPTRFVLTAGNFTSPPLGTAASCWETFQQVTRGLATGFSSDRTVIQNAQPVPTPATGWAFSGPVAGGYCIYIGPGDYSYANFQVY